MTCLCMEESNFQGFIHSFFLMTFRTYRLSQQVKPLIWIECQVEKHSRSRIEYLVQARSLFKDRSTATSVEIMLPLPPDAISPVVKSSQASSHLSWL